MGGQDKGIYFLSSDTVPQVTVVIRRKILTNLHKTNIIYNLPCPKTKDWWKKIGSQKNYMKNQLIK